MDKILIKDMNEKDIKSNQESENKEVSFNTSLSYSEIGLFYNNPDLLFIFKKTQKVAYALCMLSDLFDGREPLRVSFRETATTLIKNSLSLTRNNIPDKTSAFDTLVASLIEALSLCEAGYLSRLISQMNFDILKKEIKSLAEMVDLKRGKRVGFEESFFDTGTPTSYKGQSDLYKRQFEVSYKGAFNPISDKIEEVAQAPKEPRSVLKENSVSPKLPNTNNKENKSKRSEIILSLLKGGKELTIKDFMVYIKDCSEKTIQRELLSLVASNVLKKTGERRWSRYSIA